MRKLKLATLALTATLIASSFVFLTPAANVHADDSISAIFPDAKLQSWVKSNADSNGDGKLSTTEKNAVKDINLYNLGIKDLTGLSVFKNTQTLIINKDKVGTINVSSFKELESLWCRNCDLTSITVSSNNSKLRTIFCDHNKLTKLDLSNLTSLEELNCSYNSDMTSLNAPGCPKLKILNCSHCSLKQGRDYFYVGNSINLNKVDVSYNKFTALDWGDKRIEMTRLNCSNNPITGSNLKVNGLCSLNYLDCSHTEITTLDVSRTALETLIISGNEKMAFPDLSNNTNLKYLYCDSTSFKSLDISNLKNLKSFGCDFSELESLKLDNPELTTISCCGSNLTSIDISKCTNLEQVAVSNNSLTALTLGNNQKLKKLYCSDNKLTSLNVSGLSALEELLCSSNKLTNLVINNNPNLFYVSCSINQLTSLHITPNISILSCHYNKIKELDISGCPPLLDLVANIESTEDSNVIEYVRESVTRKYYDDLLIIDSGTKLITSAKSSSGNTDSPSTDVTITPSGESGENILGFVTRLYIYVLGRDPEPDGAAYWSSELYNFRQTGAQVAQGFIFSKEFIDRNTSNSDFVTILYKTFFGRDPETDGFNYWVGQLDAGSMSRERVALGFIYSQEWADTCASYGIRSGGDIKPSGAIKPTDLTYGFVERMYNRALERGYDEEGKQYWASKLANYELTGEQVGIEFFLSTEMNNSGISNEEFVRRLYLTFMDREGETEGMNYWVGQLNGGASRRSVVLGFTRSAEFVEKCVTARILPY